MSNHDEVVRWRERAHQQEARGDALEALRLDAGDQYCFTVDCDIQILGLDDRVGCDSLGCNAVGWAEDGFVTVSHPVAGDVSWCPKHRPPTSNGGAAA